MKRILVVGALALVAILVAGCGGSHRCSASITLRAVPAKGQRVTPAGMELARKIVVGNAQITEPSMEAAQRTALVLQSGSLPYSFQPVGRALSSVARVPKVGVEPTRPSRGTGF
jgi:hypothetical protein